MFTTQLVYLLAIIFGHCASCVPYICTPTRKKANLLWLDQFYRFEKLFSLPAARLFTNEINLAICKASRNCCPTPLSEHLRADLEWWKFLEWLQGCCSWPKEAHENVDVLCSDASNVLISLVWSHFCSMFSGYSWLLARPGISTWYCFEGNPCPRYRHFNPFHQLCSTAGLGCSLTARS